MKRMIFIEGLPGIGKTTLVNYLMGYPKHQLMTRFMYPNSKLDIIKERLWRNMNIQKK